LKHICRESAFEERKKQMSDIVKTDSMEKLPAVLDSRVVVEKLNEIRSLQGQEAKLHKNFLQDLDNELQKMSNENTELKTELGVNIEEFFETRAGKKVRSHVMMCEDTADMMISRESPSVRIAMKRELRKALTQPNPDRNMAIAATMNAEQLSLLLEVKKSEEKALQQAEYQNKALTTSQTRNALKTKENNKLRAKLRGYAEDYASIAQYVTTEKINVYGISTNSIVTMLKTIATPEQDIVKQTLKGDKYASFCFSIEFLDAHKEDIQVMIELLKEGKPLAKHFTF
jgi:hypothetical protein